MSMVNLRQDKNRSMKIQGKSFKKSILLATSYVKVREEEKSIDKGIPGFW